MRHRELGGTALVRHKVKGENKTKKGRKGLSVLMNN